MAANNDRAWFKVNRQRYEDAVLEPALTFIASFGAHLTPISRHFVADAQLFATVYPLGGESLLRPPRGYDPASPLLEDLRRKDFFSGDQRTHHPRAQP